MEVISTPLQDCYIIKAQKHGDNRGFFLESFNQKKFSEGGINIEVKQVNFAKSSKNVLRGLHYQLAPMAQAKLVGVISGAVIDFAVDLRQSSPTFGKSFQLELSSPETLLYVPRGFAHGYYTLEDDTIFYYAVDNFYSPENERGVLFTDPELNLLNGIAHSPIISEKDKNQPLFKNALLFE